MVTVAAAAGRRKKGSRLWWQVHQWAGLQASLFLAFVFLTGTLAVFSYEIDWLLRPVMWVNPSEVVLPASWGDVAAAVAAHDPEAEVLSLSVPLHPAAAIDALIQSDGEKPRHVYVHPGTGAVLGEGDWAGVQRFMRNTHRHLMIDVTYGVSVVSLAAILLLVSLVTSFAVYKNWWRGFFRWPRGRTLRALVGDLHRFVGIWSIWFISIFIVTGLWYLVEVWGGDAPIPARPGLETAAPLPPPQSAAAALDRGIALIEARQPGFRIASILAPRDEFPAFTVQGESGRAILIRPRVDAFWIDARTGEILGEIDPRRLSAHQRISEAADPLHFGTFGGYWTKTIWFLFGAGLTAMAVTGVMIYALRIARGREGAPSAGEYLRLAWRSMGRARWIALGLCLLPCVLALFVL
jgi:uncharacterized iron-regulated membrane protein